MLQGRMHKLLILLACNFLGSQGQYFCMHNQFRCTSGQCLSTEQLCNGRRDCSNGEDEQRSGSPWNCRQQTLTRNVNCNPITEFGCRFGGCISRQRLCDKQVDCWGGGDEAYDICQGGKPKSPEVSGGSAVSVQQSRPAPTARPRPVQIPTEPATRRTTTVRSNPPPIVTNNRFGSGACPPISDDPNKGFEVNCENERFYSVDCANPPEGATAVYSCRKYYTPTSSLFISARRTCQNGQWSALNNKFQCEADCGNSASDTGAFIVGGSTAKAGKWPWMVAIYERSSRSDPNKLDFICGGSLISSKAVVTAAHCVVRRDNGQKKRLNELKIVVGKYYRSYERQSTGEQESDIGDVYVHPEYNRVTLNSDIAIIKLAKPVQITEAVRPVCLPQSRDYVQQEDRGTLVGWGRGDNKAFQQQLQQAELPVVLSRTCIDAHPQFAQLVHQGTFCAGYRNGTSACDGDSGGPLVFRDRFSPGKYILHGVVSAGIAASDGRSGCNPNYYTVFTDVGYITIRRWISVIVEQFSSS